MNDPIESNDLSREAMEVVQMINEIAADLMFSAYPNLTPGMKIKLSNLTRNTSRMLEEKG